MTDIKAADDALSALPQIRFNSIGRSGNCAENSPICSPTVHNRVSSVVTFFLFALVLTGMIGCQNEQKSLEKITIAVAIQPLSAPVYVAHEMGFFKEEGLDVAIESHVLGKDALASVLNGTAQFGTAAETPLMFAGLKGEKISIIATIADSNQYQKIVARKDRGISGPRDLIGKRICMTAGTTTEYHLDTLLAYYGIADGRMQKVAMKPEEMPVALAKGDIDAAVAWPPYTEKMLKLLGNNALMIEDDKIYSIYWNIVSAREFAQTHPETVIKLLRALARAERYINGNTASVSTLMAKTITSEKFMMAEYNFDLYQGQNLLLSMEDQARWAIKMRLTGLKSVPNFLPLFYVQGVKAVAPEALSSELDTGKE